MTSVCDLCMYANVSPFSICTSFLLIVSSTYPSVLSSLLSHIPSFPFPSLSTFVPLLVFYLSLLFLLLGSPLPDTIPILYFSFLSFLATCQVSSVTPSCRLSIDCLESSKHRPPPKIKRNHTLVCAEGDERRLRVTHPALSGFPETGSPPRDKTK